VAIINVGLETLCTSEDFRTVRTLSPLGQVVLLQMVCDFFSPRRIVVAKSTLVFPSGVNFVEVFLEIVFALKISGAVSVFAPEGFCGMVHLDVRPVLEFVRNRVLAKEAHDRLSVLLDSPMRFFLVVLQILLTFDKAPACLIIAPNGDFGMKSANVLSQIAAVGATIFFAVHTLPNISRVFFFRVLLEFFCVVGEKSAHVGGLASFLRVLLLQVRQ